MVTIRGVQVTADEVHALAVLMREDRSLTMRQIAFGNALGRASMADAGTLAMDGEQAHGVQRALARMLNISPNLVRLARVCAEAVQPDPIISVDSASAAGTTAEAPTSSSDRLDTD